MIHERSVIIADPYILLAVIIFTLGIILLSEINSTRKGR